MRVWGGNWRRVIIYRRLLSWRMSRRINRGYWRCCRMKMLHWLRFRKTRRGHWCRCLRRMTMRKKFMSWIMSWRRLRIIWGSYSSRRGMMKKIWKFNMKILFRWKKNVGKWLWSLKKKRKRKRMWKKKIILIIWQIKNYLHRKNLLDLKTN